MSQKLFAGSNKEDEQMAKLNGVKTLDMVNGEITKVAYGGAEYVKAEGLPKKGDLVRAEEGGYDITSFYKITDDADHADDVRRTT
ncbi:hypothetical protein [Bacillus velezensis]|uniref:hypothetical protein n=1 Tax=Bacillus velezensis TaxID=492670 RepID=UPI001E3A2800|nr:hypothetical protein [Bacillus velezensis]